MFLGGFLRIWIDILGLSVLSLVVSEFFSIKGVFEKIGVNLLKTHTKFNVSVVQCNIPNFSFDVDELSCRVRTL